MIHPTKEEREADGQFGAIMMNLKKYVSLQQEAERIRDMLAHIRKDDNWKRGLTVSYHSEDSMTGRDGPRINTLTAQTDEEIEGLRVLLWDYWRGRQLRFIEKSLATPGLDGEFFKNTSIDRLGNSVEADDLPERLG